MYTLEEGVIWISSDLNAIINKVSEYAVSSFINSIIGEYLGCKIRRFSLHKNIINSVLGIESIQSGNYVNHHPDPDRVEGKTIRDKRLMHKSEGRETDEKYDRNSSFHKVDEINDSKIGVNVNSQLGKISLRAHLRKSDIKIYSLKIIHRIIDEMANVRETDIDTYFKGIQLDDLESFSNISKSGKAISRDIIIAINKMKSENKTDVSINYPITEMYSKLKTYFDFFFIPICDSCGSHLYTCTEMETSASADFTAKSFNLICRCCDSTVTDIANHFECSNCGSKYEAEIEEYTMAIPSAEFIDKINNAVDEVNLKYKIEPNEIVKISNYGIELLKVDYKYLYLFDELPSFEKVPALVDIDETIAKAQFHNVRKLLKEKCTNYDDSNCRNCLIDRKGHCLQRVIAFFTDGDLHAHSSVEFGDISFKEKMDGSWHTIVGLAKSYESAPKIRGKDDHKYTMKNNGGLLNQVVETIFDSRIEFMAIISGADLDPRLRSSIETLVMLQNKKVVFFETKELTRICSQYTW
ncbi:MAG: hypothetical protein PWQ50_532 [Methanolobus sp.]|nr:hypothetical protein [Methanolobus sp.]